MSEAFLLFLILLLITRGLFYYLPLRRTVSAFGAKTLVEVGLFFALFRAELVTGTAVPSIVLLLNLLGWITETILPGDGAPPGSPSSSPATLGQPHASGIPVPDDSLPHAAGRTDLGAGRDEPANVRHLATGQSAIPTLLLTLAAMGFVFGAANAPELNPIGRELISRLGSITLFRIAVGLFALFEVGHVTPALPSTPGRVVIFGFSARGAAVATALVAIAAVTADSLTVSPSQRRKTIRRSIIAATLTFLLGTLARYIPNIW